MRTLAISKLLVGYIANTLLRNKRLLSLRRGRYLAMGYRPSNLTGKQCRIRFVTSSDLLSSWWIFIYLVPSLRSMYFRHNYILSVSCQYWCTLHFLEKLQNYDLSVIWRSLIIYCPSGEEFDHTTLFTQKASVLWIASTGYLFTNATIGMSHLIRSAKRSSMSFCGIVVTVCTLSERNLVHWNWIFHTYMTVEWQKWSRSVTTSKLSNTFVHGSYPLDCCIILCWYVWARR